MSSLLYDLQFSSSSLSFFYMVFIFCILRCLSMISYCKNYNQIFKKLCFNTIFSNISSEFKKVNTIKKWEIQKGKTALRKNFFRLHVVFIEKKRISSRLYCTWTWWWLWGWPCSSTPTSPSTPSHRTRYRCSTRQPGISPRSDNTIREFSSQLKNNQSAIAQTIKSKRPDPDFRVMTCCVIHDGERNYGHFKCRS